MAQRKKKTGKTSKKPTTKKDTPVRKHSKRKPETAKELGRPSKFTDEIRQKIYDALFDVPFLDHAAGRAGVTKRTIQYWLQKGHKDDDDGIESDFSIFFRRVNEIWSEVESDLFSVVKTAARKHPENAKYILQCMRPKTYANKQAIRVEDKNDKNGAFEGDNLHNHLVGIVNDLEGEK